MQESTRNRLKRLKSLGAFIAFLLVLKPVFQFIGAVSNFDFAISASGNPRMVAVWNFLNTPLGNMVFLAAGLVWLAYLIVRPEKDRKLIAPIEEREAERIGEKASRIGRLVSTVYDGQGQCLEGANVIALNDETQREYSGATGEDGEVQIRVPVGRYTVTAQREGFQSATHAAEVESRPGDSAGYVQLVLQKAPEKFGLL